jgi:hypothetical protein
MILTNLWWGWGVMLLLALVALSSQAAIFGDQAEAAWQWFLPNILPTLGLVGAAAYSRRSETDVDPSAIRPLFLIALAVSVTYLLLLSLSVVGVLFSSDPIAWLNKSALWLGPLQGLAASGLGVFFTK